MQERRQDALNLNSRVAVLETVFQDIKSMKEDVSEILNTMAEQRGAAKAMKVIWGAGVAVLGLASGWIGSFVRHM